MIKSIRSEQMAKWEKASSAAMTVANNFGMVNNSVPTFLNLVNMAHRVVGAKPLEMVSHWLNRVRTAARRLAALARGQAYPGRIFRQKLCCPLCVFIPLWWHSCERKSEMEYKSL